MADYIHVRNDNNIVDSVWSSSRTPQAGRTEFFENHPIFAPNWNVTRWERQGVDTYIDIGQGIIVSPPGAEFTQTWILQGGTNSAGTNGTTDLGIGASGATAGIIAITAGELIGLCIAVTDDRTGGTLTGYFVLDGVSQTAAGEFVEINATNLNRDSIVLETPIAFDAQAKLGIRVVASGYGTSGQKNASMGAFIRNVTNID
jgi:hypothetical protein